jgi:hypothetical protein
MCQSRLPVFHFTRATDTVSSSTLFISRFAMVIVAIGGIGGQSDNLSIETVAVATLFHRYPGGGCARARRRRLDPRREHALPVSIRCLGPDRRALRRSWLPQDRGPRGLAPTQRPQIFSALPRGIPLPPPRASPRRQGRHSMNIVRDIAAWRYPASTRGSPET